MIRQRRCEHNLSVNGARQQPQLQPRGLLNKRRATDSWVTWRGGGRERRLGEHVCATDAGVTEAPGVTVKENHQLTPTGRH